MHNSVKLGTSCEFINLTPINPLISRCQIKVCYVGDEPNRNNSIITKDVAKELANSLPGSPIVGYFNTDKGDFEGHNREIDITDGQFHIKDTTKPYGFVDLNAKCWFQKFLDEGVEHEYLMTEGYLWTGQYPEAQRIIERGNNQSMELDENFVKGNWTKSDNGEPQFFIINEAIISKLCILGEDVEPCFEGAQISKVQFCFEDGFKQQLFSMIEQLKEILNEGGEFVEKEKETNTIDNQEEEKEEVCPHCGKPLSECECEEEEKENEDKKDKYVLDEIQEYVELLARHSNLENSFNELEMRYNSMKADYEELVNFKKSVEKKEKQSMIDSFYMLSAEDKKEVQENIDNYTLEEIEAKLSIICVRNKVNFNLEDDGFKDSKNNPTAYNLREVENENVPAWIKAVQTVAKETC